MLSFWFDIQRRMLAAAIAAALLHDCAATSLAEQAAADDAFVGRVVPFVRGHCTDCHGDEEPAAELNLLRWKTAADATADRANWERVRRVLARHEMPPADQQRPPAEEIKAVISWIDSTVLKIDCSRPQPGRVAIRRLNR